MIVIYTNEAEKDLEDITNYLLQYNEPNVVAKRISKVKKDVELLERTPNIGTRLNNICEIKSDYRFLVSSKYLIIYLIAKDYLGIISVLDGRQDWQKAFFTKRGE